MPRDADDVDNEGVVAREKGTKGSKNFESTRTLFDQFPFENYASRGPGEYDARGPQSAREVAGSYQEEKGIVIRCQKMFPQKFEQA